MTVRVLVGDARAVLAGLPEASVHTCICSPPYFGLRNYSTEPVEWGGSPGCEHEWSLPDAARKSTPHSGLPFCGANSPEAMVVTFENRAKGSSQTGGATCSLCNCWRGELGAEPTPDLYVAHLVEVFAAVRRCLRPDGSLWVVIGDSFVSGGRIGHGTRVGYKQQTNRGSNGQNDSARPPQPPGLREKELIGIPWLFAFAMRRDGWLIRQELIWSKSSCMPESVTDRCTRAHETVFMFVRQGRYFYDAEAIKEPTTNGERFHGGYDKPGVIRGCNYARNGRDNIDNQTTNRNKRSVWTINPEPLAEPHYAAYPSKLVDPMVRASTSERGVCAACGAPWRRVVERTTVRQIAEQSGWNPRVSPSYEVLEHGNNQRSGLSVPGSLSRRGLKSPTAETVGWSPTCACNADDPRPAIVLDPFAGSGTTGLAAQRLGRDAILIELNPQYREIIEKRLEADRLARDPILREQAAARADGWTAPTLWEVTP